MGNTKSQKLKEQYIKGKYNVKESRKDQLLGLYSILQFHGYDVELYIQKVLNPAEYDEYADINEFIKKLSNSCKSICEFYFVEYNTQNQDLFDLVFEFGVPLTLPFKKEKYIWALIEQLTDGLLFLEENVLHYPFLHKNYIVQTSDKNFKLVNPYCFPDYLKEVLQIYMNPMNPVSNRKIYSQTQIKRNLREFAVLVITLIQSHSVQRLLKEPNYWQEVLGTMRGQISPELENFVAYILQQNANTPQSFNDIRTWLNAYKPSFNTSKLNIFSSKTITPRKPASMAPSQNRKVDVFGTPKNNNSMVSSLPGNDNSIEGRREANLGQSNQLTQFYQDDLNRVMHKSMSQKDISERHQHEQPILPQTTSQQHIPQFLHPQMGQPPMQQPAQQQIPQPVQQPVQQPMTQNFFDVDPRIEYDKPQATPDYKRESIIKAPLIDHNNKNQFEFMNHAPSPNKSINQYIMNQKDVRDSMFSDYYLDDLNKKEDVNFFSFPQTKTPEVNFNNVVIQQESMPEISQNAQAKLVPQFSLPEQDVTNQQPQAKSPNNQNPMAQSQPQPHHQQQPPQQQPTTSQSNPLPHAQTQPQPQQPQQPPQPQVPQQQLQVPQQPQAPAPVTSPKSNKKIHRVLIKWVREENKYQKTIEYTDGSSEIVPMDNEEDNQYKQFTSKYNDKPQPQVPVVPENDEKRSHMAVYDYQNIHSFNKSSSFITSPENLMIMMLYQDNSEPPLLLFKTQSNRDQPYFQNVSSIVDQGHPIRPSMYHQIEDDPTVEVNRLKSSMVNPFENSEKKPATAVRSVNEISAVNDTTMSMPTSIGMQRRVLIQKKAI